MSQDSNSRQKDVPIPDDLVFGSSRLAKRQAAKADKKKRRRKKLIISAIIILAALLIIFGSGIGYYIYREHQLQHIKVGNLTQEVSGQPLNILLVGNNSRCVLNGKQAQAFGSCSEVGGARSDVIMIVHINPNTHSLSLLSIPRDLFVEVPGFEGSAPGRYDHAKIDAGLNLGPGELVKTITEDFGIPIQHYVQLNFDTFQGVVDDLGGLSVYFPTAVKDYESGLNIGQSGCFHLNGTQALALVRARHMYYKDHNGVWQYDGNGDISRIQRDHEFLRLLAAQVKPRVTDPLTANSIIGSILPQLQVDDGFGLSEMASLAWAFHNTDPNSIPTFTLPTTPISSFSYRGAGFGSVVFPVQPADQNVINAFLGSNPASQVNPSSFTVSVLNGTGAGNLATKTSNSLKSLGFNVTAIGDDPIDSSPVETTVYYQPGYQNQAEKVLENLGGTALIAPGLPYNSGTLSPALTSANVVIVVGQNAEVLPPPSSNENSGGTTTSTTIATPPGVSTTIPGENSTGPINPAEVYPAQPSYPWYDPTACPAT